MMNLDNIRYSWMIALWSLPVCHHATIQIIEMLLHIIKHYVSVCNHTLFMRQCDSTSPVQLRYFLIFGVK